MKALDLMSKNVATIEHNQDLLSAIRLMLKQKTRHLLVIKDQHVVGVLSAEELKHVKKSFECVKAGEVCDRFVVFAPQSTDVADISSIFEQFKLQVLAVLNDLGYVAGIITPMDFIKAMAGKFPQAKYA